MVPTAGLLRLSPDARSTVVRGRSFGLGRHGFASERSEAPRSSCTFSGCDAETLFFSKGSSARLNSSTVSDTAVSCALDFFFFAAAGPSWMGAPPRSVAATRPLSTSFQSPLRIAPVVGVVLSRIASCGEGFPWAIVGQASRPSSGCCCSNDAPASLSSVGYQSTMCSGSLTTVPGSIRPGQVAQAGTRTPPSYNVPLPARSWPLVATELTGPPLSLEKRNRVRFVSPRFSTAATTLPDLLVEAVHHGTISPAFAVGNVRVELELLVECLERSMRRVERHVEEQWFPSILLLDQPHGFVAEEHGGVAWIAVFLVVAVPVVATVALVGEVVEGAVIVPVLPIEASSRREVLGAEMTEVPFAADRRGVTGLPECLRESAFVERQSVLGPRPDDADLQTVAHRVTPGQQRRARGRADGLNVKLLQPRTSGGKLVEVRCLDLAAVPAHIGPAEIIGEEKNDVRW